MSRCGRAEQSPLVRYYSVLQLLRGIYLKGFEEALGSHGREMKMKTSMV